MDAATTWTGLIGTVVGSVATVLVARYQARGAAKTGKGNDVMSALNGLTKEIRNDRKVSEESRKEVLAQIRALRQVHERIASSHETTLSKMFELVEKVLDS